MFHCSIHCLTIYLSFLIFDRTRSSPIKDLTTANTRYYNTIYQQLSFDNALTKFRRALIDNLCIQCLRMGLARSDSCRLYRSFIAVLRMTYTPTFKSVIVPTSIPPSLIPPPSMKDDSSDQSFPSFERSLPFLPLVARFFPC